MCYKDSAPAGADMNHYRWIQPMEVETSTQNLGALVPMKKGLLIEERKKMMGTC